MIKFTSSKNLIFFMVVFAIAVGNAGSTLYLPALVTITHELATTSSLVKLSLSCYLLSFGLSQIIYGPLSDAFGRRKVLISGLVIFVIGSLIVASANAIPTFLFGRLIEGLGIGAANAVGYALIRDIYSGNELIRKLSYVSIFVGLTPIVAPLCGGYLVEYFNWKACFITLALLAGSLVTLQILRLPETNISTNSDAIKLKTLINNYIQLLSNLEFLSYILTSAIGFSSLLSLNAVLPFIMIKHLNIQPSNYGWLTLLTGGGYLSGSFIGGIIATKTNAKVTIKLGTLINFIAALIAFIIAQYEFNIVVVIIPLILVLFGIGFIVPISAGGAMSLFPQMAGSAAALLGATMFAISAIFTSIVAHIPTETQKPLFIFLIILSLLAYLTITCIKGHKNV